MKTKQLQGFLGFSFMVIALYTALFREDDISALVPIVCALIGSVLLYTLEADQKRKK